MLSNLMSILRILMMVMGITKSSRSTLLSKNQEQTFMSLEILADTRFLH